MSNLSVAQIIMDAQRMASRVKDLDALGSSLLMEAESNNRYIESLRQFQDDIDSLNRLSNNKSNAEMVNRIQQQNAQSLEILKENRELKVCIEDYERGIELIMQKYREHMSSKVLESRINLKEAYNEKLWGIIQDQSDKINEMAAVMHRAANIGDEDENRNLELLAHVTRENKTLRELLQISHSFSHNKSGGVQCEEKAVQTGEEFNADLSSSVDSTGNTDQSLLQASVSSVPAAAVDKNDMLALDDTVVATPLTTDPSIINAREKPTNCTETPSLGATIICNENASSTEQLKEDSIIGRTTT